MINRIRNIFYFIIRNLYKIYEWYKGKDDVKTWNRRRKRRREGRQLMNLFKYIVSLNGIKYHMDHLEFLKWATKNNEPSDYIYTVSLTI